MPLGLRDDGCELSPAFAGKTRLPIRADTVWQREHAAKPKHFDDMTPAEQAAFKMKLDRKFKPIPVLVAKSVWEATNRGEPDICQRKTGERT
jgi:hypothetical protein